MNASNAIQREAAAMLPVYPQMSFVPEASAGCYITTAEGRDILDLYGGHAVAALGYGHPVLTKAIARQAEQLIFQSNAVALDIRAEAAEKLCSAANLERAFFVNSGAEANENALRVACMATERKKVLALTHGFHGRTAAAAAVTWKSQSSWYGFPQTPFEIDFIERNDVDAARDMIDDEIAAVIFEPVQGVAGAFDLSTKFVRELRTRTQQVGALLIADEVQSGMGRSGEFFAVHGYGIEPDLMTSAKSLAGGVPCGALLVSEALAAGVSKGQLGSTFGGCPIAAAAVVAMIDTIRNDDLLRNVREREAQIRNTCLTGPVTSIQGKGFLLGLVCNVPASQVQAALLEQNILTGTSADPRVLRLLPPLVLQPDHVLQLADALSKV